MSRWLTFAASAMLAAVLGIRLITRAAKEASGQAGASTPTPEPARRPEPRAKPKSRSNSKTNGSVPPEMAEPTPSRPADASAAESASEPSELDLDAVLDCLDRHRQRATYGAVAAVVGKLPVNVMQGRDRIPRHSWVVSLKTGKPTRYQSAEMHAELTANDEVIADGDALRAWLAARG